jgi:hypothetical protein
MRHGFVHAILILAAQIAPSTVSVVVGAAALLSEQSNAK